MKSIETYPKLVIFTKELKDHKYRICTKKHKKVCRAEVFDITILIDIEVVAAYESDLGLEEFKYDMDDLAERYNHAEIQ